MREKTSAIRKLRRAWRLVEIQVKGLGKPFGELEKVFRAFETRCCKSLSIQSPKERVTYGSFWDVVNEFGTGRGPFTVDEFFDNAELDERFSRRSCAANLYKIARSKPHLLQRTPGSRGFTSVPAQYRLVSDNNKRKHNAKKRRTRSRRD